MKIWSLVICNDSYTHPDLSNLSGSALDGISMERFLRIDLQVVEKCIKVLRNGTRAEMLESFQRHLIDNPEIVYGEPLLLYFSGHGTRIPAPDGWPADPHLKKDRRRVQLMEAICPVDVGPNVPSIPDRTLACLLMKASLKHGLNITVILDCCHGGHGTRGPWDALPSGYAVRRSSLRTECRLDERTDEDIWADMRQLDLSSFRDRQGRSHVLISACRREEDAFEKRGGGGLLTSFLTTNWGRKGLTLSSTYADLSRHIAEQFSNFCTAMGLKSAPQSPQVEGACRARTLFGMHRNGKWTFPAIISDYQGRVECIVFAGIMHGLSKNTTFRLYLAEPSRNGEKFMAAGVKATELSSVRCVLPIPEAISLDRHASYYVETSQPRQASLYITSAARRRWQVLDMIASSPRIPGISIDDRMQAQIIIDAGERQDNLSVSLGAAHGSGSASFPLSQFFTPAIVLQTVSDISLFNFFLFHCNPRSSLDASVEIAFGVLSDTVTAQATRPMSRRKRAQLETVQSDNITKIIEASSGSGKLTEFTAAKGQAYALLVNNRTKSHLYPHIYHFNLNNYHITRAYSPRTEDAPLPSQGTLRLGRSSEFMETWRFNEDVVLKVFLTTDPLADLSCIEHPFERSFALDPDLRGNYASRTRSHVQTDLWDALQVRVHVVGE